MNTFTANICDQNQRKYEAHKIIYMLKCEDWWKLPQTWKINGASNTLWWKSGKKIIPLSHTDCCYGNTCTG